MDVVVKERQEGKTTELVKWVLEGTSTTSYPFWTRVLVVPTMVQADLVRSSFRALDYHQVFYFQEWVGACLGREPVEIAMDNIEQLLEHGALRGRSRIALVSINGTLKES